MRQIAQDKLKLILELKGNPIILIACKKQGLAPSTFYRWKNSDRRFAKEVNRSITRGRETVSDIAEAHLVQAIKKGNLRAVLYWLKVFRHPYKKADKTVVEVRNTNVMEKRTEKRGRRNVLLPTIPVDDVPKLSPKLEKQLKDGFGRMMKTFERNRRRDTAVKEIMYKKGFTPEEIKEILERMDEKE